MAVSRELTEVASRLLRRPAFPVRANLFAKSAGHNWPVAWHQDRVVQIERPAEAAGFDGWSVKNGRDCANAPIEVLSQMVALRLHLDDCRANDGAVHAIPGSQDQIWTPDQVRKLGRPSTLGTEVVMTAQAGDVWAMRPLLLHRSGRIEGDTLRRVLHVEYAAEDLPSSLRWAVEA